MEERKWPKGYRPYMKRKSLSVRQVWDDERQFSARACHPSANLRRFRFQVRLHLPIVLEPDPRLPEYPTVLHLSPMSPICHPSHPPPYCPLRPALHFRYAHAETVSVRAYLLHGRRDRAEPPFRRLTVIDRIHTIWEERVDELKDHEQLREPVQVESPLWSCLLPRGRVSGLWEEGVCRKDRLGQRRGHRLGMCLDARS